MAIHDYYLQLTPDEKTFVDDHFREAFREAKVFSVSLLGDDRAERAVEAFAKWVVESRPAPEPAAEPVPERRFALSLTQRERDHVLAGLRALQELRLDEKTGEVDTAEWSDDDEFALRVATAVGEHKLMIWEELDDLCERINGFLMGRIVVAHTPYAGTQVYSSIPMRVLHLACKVDPADIDHDEEVIYLRDETTVVVPEQDALTDEHYVMLMAEIGLAQIKATELAARGE